ncbi:T9SS type A sorting domain-containing protein, partial [bacterium]|nr:T9SS type A sorting domain-containing protein [bacterium]
ETQYATHGYAALKVTTAHEFFHTIQFRYLYNFDLSWWMEQSAVWMEERAWDDVNDYLAYLHHFFGGSIGNETYPEYYKVTSLNENYPSNFKYGAAIWAMFLAKRYGDSQIRTIWETLRDSSYPHIADFDKAIKNNTSGASGLPDALNEFAIWNYFTRERANTVDFYSDSDRFNVAIDSDFFWSYSPASDSIGIKNLTSRYVELLFVGNWDKNDILKINVIPHNTQLYRSSVVFFNDPYDYEIQPVTQQNTELILSKHWNRAILVTSSAELLNNTSTFTFETGMIPGTAVETAKPYVFDLHGAYPNPFNPSTTIAFSLHQEEQVSIRVFNAQGQKVDDVFSGDMTAGEKYVLWKPSGQAAGVYFIMIQTPSLSKTTKVLLLK